MSRAAASSFDTRPNAILCCQRRECRFSGRPSDFLDAREYSLAAEDAFDCPCCGYSDVVEITTAEPHPAMPVVDLRGQTLRDIYQG